MTYEPVEIATPGATLVGDRWNGAGATIVLLHAGVCDRRCWREVGARLGASGRDVVAYDRRGFGDVSPPGGPFRHVDDLLAVLDAVSPDAPAWLVGSSMGGEVALDAALEAPERVAGLVLLAPAISGDPEPARRPTTPRRTGSRTQSMPPGRPAHSRNAIGSRSGCGSTGQPSRRDG